MHARDNMGRTPLHWAAKGNSVEVARLLIKAGADVAARNKDGNTPLDLATQRENQEMIKLLKAV